MLRGADLKFSFSNFAIFINAILDTMNYSLKNRLKIAEIVQFKIFILALLRYLNWFVCTLIKNYPDT